MSARGAAARALVGSAVAVAVVGCGASTAPAPVRIGAVFPLAAANQPASGQELTGIRIALDLVNAAGGARGRQLQLDVRDVDSVGAAPYACGIS